MDTGSEAPRKLPYALLKKLQADGSNVSAPMRVIQQPKKMSSAARAVQKAMESAQKKASKSKSKPTEVSNSAPVMPDRPQEVNLGPKKLKARDPRFSDMSGKLNSDAFAASYSFLNDIRSNEMKTMESKLKNSGTSDREKDSIKKKLDSMRIQDKQRQRAGKEQEIKRRLQKQEREKIATTGKTPFFFSKTAIRKEMQTERFQELSQKGLVDAVIAKKRKKLSKNEKTMIPKRRRILDEE